MDNNFKNVFSGICFVMSCSTTMNRFNLFSKCLLFKSEKNYLISKIPALIWKNDSKWFHSTPKFLFREDQETKTIALLDNVKQVKYAPPAALTLGFSGLAPFIAAPMYMVSSSVFMPTIAYAQLAYGAVILSFIGGVRWGLTLPKESTQRPDWHNLGYSVTPSLVAWVGLLTSPTIGTLTLMGGMAIAGYMDIAMWGYPNWFKGLRFCLTFIAVLSLWTTLMCKVILSNERMSIQKSSSETET